jgi:hypothetical protein
MMTTTINGAADDDQTRMMTRRTSSSGGGDDDQRMTTMMNAELGRTMRDFVAAISINARRPIRLGGRDALQYCQGNSASLECTSLAGRHNDEDCGLWYACVNDDCLTDDDDTMRR